MKSSSVFRYAISCATAREALSVLRVRDDITLVVTDIHMSDALEGVDLIREIRKSYPAIKVITASAYRGHEQVEASINKPYSLERLLSVIKSVLAR